MTGKPTAGQTLEVQQPIERLWHEGRRKSIERVSVIESTAAGLLLGDGTDLGDAISAAHKLAGTLGMFGLPGGSILARKIERTLESPELAEADLEPLADLIVELRTSIESGPDRPDPSPPMADRPILHLVGSDRSYVEALKLGAESRGFDVRVYPNPNLIPDADEAGIAVFDCVSADRQDILSWAGLFSQALLVAVGATTDVSTRIALSSIGVHLVMGSDTEAGRALELIGDELDRRRRSGRVRLVNPTPGVTSGIEIAIENWNLTRITADELFVGNNRADDVVVLDATAVDPAEAAHLCRSIRASPVSRHLPVLVVLAGEPEVGVVVGRLLAAGADDVSWGLGTQLAERVQKLGLRMIAQGPGTMLASSTPGTTMSVSDRLDTRIEINGGAGGQMTVSFITPRNLTEINERGGRDAGDELLVQLGQTLAIRFRADDLAGRWGAGYVIVLDGDLATASERLRGLVLEIERSGLELVTATAVLGEDGNDGATLIDVAARRCRPSSDAPASGVDDDGRAILLVEDDSLIVTLVTDLLTSRGHRVEVAADGPTAADLLSSPEAVNEYKLVVLDVSLPGLDGFGVLRQMRRSQPESALPVVLVTARATEEEIVAGLDLGAVDHVAKPFSPLVLIRRLERALEL